MLVIDGLTRSQDSVYNILDSGETIFDQDKKTCFNGENDD
jgi:hypothetical protein